MRATHAARVHRRPRSRAMRVPRKVRALLRRRRTPLSHPDTPPGSRAHDRPFTCGVLRRRPPPPIHVCTSQGVSSLGTHPPGCAVSPPRGGCRTRREGRAAKEDVPGLPQRRRRRQRQLARSPLSSSSSPSPPSALSSGSSSGSVHPSTWWSIINQSHRWHGWT